MYCPKCGQPQSSDLIRFCSRCGVDFDQVANLIERDFNKPSPDRDQSLKTHLLAMAMYILIAILAITGWGPWSGPQGTRIQAIAIIVSVLAFILLFSGPFRQMIHKLLPRNCELGKSSQPIEQKRSGVDAPTLPPAQSVPWTGRYQQRVNTAEMVPQPSVTEHTTALLEKK